MGTFFWTDSLISDLTEKWRCKNPGLSDSELWEALLCIYAKTEYSARQHSINPAGALSCKDPRPRRIQHTNWAKNDLQRRVNAFYRAQSSSAKSTRMVWPAGCVASARPWAASFIDIMNISFVICGWVEYSWCSSSCQCLGYNHSCIMSGI